MNDDIADEALMMRFRDGDATAFEALYSRHKGPLYRYFLRQCTDAAVAEELFQDVWLKLVNARQRYVPRARFATYLYHLAHNRLIDHYRKHNRASAVPFEDEDGPPAAGNGTDGCDGPERRVGVREQSTRLLELIAALPAVQREAFLLREEGGLSLEEIAASTGVGRETAKSRLRYAVAFLRKGLEGYQ